MTAERLGLTLGVCLRDVSVMRGLAVEPPLHFIIIFLRYSRRNKKRTSIKNRFWYISTTPKLIIYNIWSSMHPRNFGCDKIIRTAVRPYARTSSFHASGVHIQWSTWHGQLTALKQRYLLTSVT